MVQGNRDIEQDVNDILATREELREKVELLRGRIRGALWQTRREIGRSIDEAKETVDGVRRMLNPAHYRHPLAIVAVIITLRYFLRQLRKRGSQTRRNRPHAISKDLRQKIGPGGRGR